MLSTAILTTLFLVIAVVMNATRLASANSGITDYKCANESTCGEPCLTLYEEFIRTYSHGWAVRHQSLGRTYNHLQCRVCAEIGVARGELSDYLLKNVPGIVEYHGIDPFLGGYDDANDAMSSYLTKLNMSDIFADTVMHVEKHHGCKFRLHKGLSSDVVGSFPDGSLDCIFIDGDHTFRGVKTDIVEWYPKVKPGGYLLFDDYSFSFPGLVHAVDGFVDTNHLKLIQINKHNNYYVGKPADPNIEMDFNFKDYNMGRYHGNPEDMR